MFYAALHKIFIRNQGGGGKIKREASSYFGLKSTKSEQVHQEVNTNSKILSYKYLKEAKKKLTCF